MAKKFNKTQLIKQALSDTPEAKPTEIAAALEKHGITATYVSNIKASMNAKPKNQADQRDQPARALVDQPLQPTL